MIYLGIGIRVLLGTMFASTGSEKLFHRRRFRRVVVDYQLLPRWAVPAFALVLPPLEVLLGATLVLGWAGYVSAIAAVTLLMLFASAVAANSIRRRNIECGCGGMWTPTNRVSWQLVGRNCLLIALATTLVFDTPVTVARLLAERQVTPSNLVMVGLIVAFVLFSAATVARMAIVSGQIARVSRALKEGNQ